MAKSKMVDLWLKKAGRDLRFSKAAMTLDEQFFDEIVFHCQQSVEKSIKAFLTFHKEPFGKTHDIGELLLSVAKIDPNLAQLLDSSKILSKYAVAIRYPDAQGLDIVIDGETANQSLTLADAVYVELSARIK
ncbi:MAG: HEPN domain-containing protein [Bdellovibrionaceae bacterium]|nr:HEPN domain-containing protein [Pseudobdellovibrionaceae bacterium]